MSKTFTVSEGGKTVEVEYPYYQLYGDREKMLVEWGARAALRALAASAGARHEAALMGTTWPDESEAEHDEDG